MQRSAARVVRVANHGAADWSPSQLAPPPPCAATVSLRSRMSQSWLLFVAFACLGVVLFVRLIDRPAIAVRHVSLRLRSCASAARLWRVCESCRDALRCEPMRGAALVHSNGDSAAAEDIESNGAESGPSPSPPSPTDRAAVSSSQPHHSHTLARHTGLHTWRRLISPLAHRPYRPLRSVPLVAMAAKPRRPMGLALQMPAEQDQSYRVSVEKTTVSSERTSAG